MSRQHPSHRNPHKPIRSAELVALIRAMSRHQRATWRHSSDSMAELFVQPLHWMYLWLARPLWWLGEKLVPGGNWYHVARSRHFDTLLVEALEDGIEQLVVLGAGYDTRAYRFRHRLGGVRIFEVDLPGTQARKKRLLTKALGELPDHVTFLATDFNQMSLAEVLASGGYEEDLRTFFLWEGVVPYLPVATIVEVLRFVAEQSGEGSRVAFDYMLQSFLDDPSTVKGGKLAMRRIDRLGEPLVTGFEPEGLVTFVRDCGLEVRSNLGPAELGAAYCVDPDGAIHEPVACFQIACCQSSSTKNAP